MSIQQWIDHAAANGGEPVGGWPKLVGPGGLDLRLFWSKEDGWHRQQFEMVTAGHWTYDIPYCDAEAQAILQKDKRERLERDGISIDTFFRQNDEAFVPIYRVAKAGIGWLTPEGGWTSVSDTPPVILEFDDFDLALIAALVAAKGDGE